MLLLPTNHSRCIQFALMEHFVLIVNMDFNTMVVHILIYIINISIPLHLICIEIRGPET